MPYRCEVLEISPDELSAIQFLPVSPVSPVSSTASPIPSKIIIDTDLGTDLDDALALLYALRLPNLEVLGVTTNYAVSVIRAEVVKRIIALHRQFRPAYPAVPVITGSSRPLGSHREYFVVGQEGAPFLSAEFRESNWIDSMNQIEQMEAADFIADVVNGHPGEVTICAIGIPTNIALAFKRHPEISAKSKEIVIMGCGSILTSSDNCDSPFELPGKGDELDFVQSGKIIHLYPNHNVSGDAEASRIVCNESSCPIRIVPFHVTAQFWLEGRAIDHLREHSVDDSPSGAVGKLMLKWFGVRRGQNGQCPHDPLVIHEARYCGDEGCLEYVRGRIVSHEWAAFATFVPHEDGPHFLGLSVKRHDEFLAQLTDVLTEPD
jgi:purine nucleosidase